MADHSELVSEMTLLETMGTQERQKLARKRRSQQIKKWNQREKERLTKERQLSKKLASASNEDSSGLILKNHTTFKTTRQNSSIGAHISQTNGRVNFDNGVMLLEAAARNDIDEVRRLLQSGVGPDSTNHDGLTALHQCCVDAFEPMMKLLIEFGANVNAKDSEQWTPLHAACTCNHSSIVKFLVDSGADLLAVNGDGNMPFDICEDEATLGNYNEHFVSEPEKKEKSPYNYSSVPIFCSRQTDHIESEMVKRNITQEIIDYTRASTEIQMMKDLQTYEAEGGDINVKLDDGVSLLHIAAANGYTSVVKYLIEHGADLNIRDTDYWTPIHGAVCWGHLQHAKVIELLVQAGADINAKTLNGEAPIDICDNPDVKERLIQLKDEMETNQLTSTTSNLRRTQSRTNCRTHSVRRTSIRDKAQISRREAREEALLRRETNSGQNISDEDFDATGANNVNKCKMQSPAITNHNIDENGNKKEDSADQIPCEAGRKLFTSTQSAIDERTKDECQLNSSHGTLSQCNGRLIENAINGKFDPATIDDNTIQYLRKNPDTLVNPTSDTQQSNISSRAFDFSPFDLSDSTNNNNDKFEDVVGSCRRTDRYDNNSNQDKNSLIFSNHPIDDKHITRSIKSNIGNLDTNAQHNTQHLQSLSNPISPHSSLVFASINCTLADLKKQRSDLRHRNVNMSLSLSETDNNQDRAKPDIQPSPDSKNSSSSSSISLNDRCKTNYNNNLDHQKFMNESVLHSNKSTSSKNSLIAQKTLIIDSGAMDRNNSNNNTSSVELNTVSTKDKTKYCSQSNGFAKRDITPPSPSQALQKFSGDPSEIVGGKERHWRRRCCALI